MFLVFTALYDAYAGYNTPDTKLKVNKIHNNADKPMFEGHILNSSVKPRDGVCELRKEREGRSVPICLY